MYDLTAAYLLIIVLLIYSGVMTYLYWREKKKGQRGRDLLDRDVDVKIEEIGDRLKEIREHSERTKIDLDDEDW